MFLPALTAALLAGAALAQQATDSVPLFSSAEPLELTVVADLEALKKDRSEDPEDRPATVVLANGDTIEAEVRPRGNFRRDPRNCSFPPIRLDVKKKSAQGTVFEGQDKLKIVSPCRPERDSFEQYVLLEYALYNAYRALTDDAFRVRLARITYIDTSGDRDPFTRYAFFIEDDNALAARMGGTVVDLPEGRAVGASFFNPRQAAQVAIFQFMIGNTDWSAEALHNVKVIQSAGPVRAVPYDFDFSGLVNTPYAVPDPRLGTRNVRERVYRGRCTDDATRADLIAHFNSARASIEAAFASVPGLDEKSARNAVSYLEDFFETISSPERAERRMFRDCLR